METNAVSDPNGTAWDEDESPTRVPRRLTDAEYREIATYLHQKGWPYPEATLADVECDLREDFPVACFEDPVSLDRRTYDGPVYVVVGPVVIDRDFGGYLLSDQIVLIRDEAGHLLALDETKGVRDPAWTDEAADGDAPAVAAPSTEPASAES